MKLRESSLATRLLLASCATAVLVIAAIMLFIKLLLIPQMTDRALSNQTSALAHSLLGVQGSPEQWTKEILAQEDILDAFSREGRTVATLFLRQDSKYVRAATTLKQADGSRAVGTLLDPASEAAKALEAGKEYSGPITLFDRPHMATYLPVSFANGTRGAVFVGIDYGSADPMLALAHQMDYVVLAVGLVSMLLLAVGLLVAIRVETTHRETEDILRTTQEGLFLLDHNLCMGTQASHAVSRILGFAVRPGENLLELLQPLVTPKTFDTAREYIELLLRHDVKEKLVASLNPLECIEIASVHANGSMASRFLQIRFNRVMKAGRITHLLVTANDITRQVRLERELKESEKRVQDQMGMMVHILQADPRLLQEFLANANNGLNHINDDLRTANPATGITTPQIDAILRAAHGLKGDAAALQLETVGASLHELETLLQALRGQAERKSEDLLPVAVRVKALYAELSAIQGVIARIAQVRGVVSVEPPRPGSAPPTAALSALLRQWQNFAQQLAGRHEKRVELSYQGMDLDSLAPHLRETLNTLVNQFIRNALVHGVETPAERKLRGKPEAARLSIYVSDQGDGMLELSFRDDGRGINTEKIRNAAVRSGRYTAEEAAALDARRLTLLIFEAGVSTHEQADEDAGRGIGLDTVKDLVGQKGGRVRIGSTRGEYCHFRIQLPLALASAPAAERPAEPTGEAAPPSETYKEVA